MRKLEVEVEVGAEKLGLIEVWTRIGLGGKYQRCKRLRKDKDVLAVLSMEMQDKSW